MNDIPFAVHTQDPALTALLEAERPHAKLCNALAGLISIAAIGLLAALPALVILIWKAAL